jgi:RHS repeat-associated protein
MASPLGNRKNSKFMAVSTAPSINKTPMGSSTPPVPYPVCHDLSNSVGIVPHVKLNSDPAYVLDQTTQSRCTGDEPGTAKGVKSGTVSGEVKPTSASGHVKITGKRVVRVGDTCTLNAGNCPGVYVAAPALSAPGASTNPPIVPETPAEKAFLEKLGLWWDETKTQLGEAAAHPVEATKGAVKDTLNIVPQLAQLLMQGSALQSAGEIEQAAALQSAFGNKETASQLHTTAEGVRQSADQIRLPQFEMTNPAQEGGAKIATAAQLATGVAGLAKGGVKLGARGMAKIGVKPAGALEKAAVKIGKTGDGFHVKGQVPGITGTVEKTASKTQTTKATSEAAREQAPNKAGIKGEPVNALTGEVVVEQKDFTLPGRIPLVWTRRYGSQHPQRGVCGRGWQTPADARLVSKDGKIIFYDGGPKGSVFASLPGNSPIQEAIGSALLSRQGASLTVRVKSGLIYHFAVPDQDFREIPADRISDQSGNWIRFIRTEDGLSQITTSAGHRIDVTSHDGLISTMELRLKESSLLLAEYGYSAEGNLLAVSDPLGVPYRFTYTEEHRMTAHTDRNGLTFRYDYEEGRCIHAYGDGGLYDYRFDYLDHMTRVTDSLGTTSILRYDDNNLLLSETDKDGHETRYDYNDAYLTSAVIDPLGRRTGYEYDASGNVTVISRPDGTQVSIVYEGTNPVRITDPVGNTWLQQWNAQGLLISQTSPQGAETHYAYDSLGGLVAVTDPLGAVTRFDIDKSGSLLGATDALGNKTSFTVDVLGAILTLTAPNGAVTAYAYDAKSRLTKVTRPTGAEVLCAYDAEDNLTSYKDEANHETRLEYTGIGEIAKRINPDGTTVQYQYDTEERLIAVTNERGETHRLRRDHKGRLIGQTDYWGNLTRYGRDPAGRLIERIDALGRTTRYVYDPLDRLTEKLFSDGTTETYAYDPNGNLTAHANNSISAECRYDKEGRLIEEHQGDFTLRNDYDLRGSRTRRTTSHGNTVEYTYDALGNTVGITINGRQVAGIARNALGQPVTETLWGTASREYTYDSEGRLTGQVLYGDHTRAQRSYAYDEVGNLIAQKDAHGTTYFTYDPRGRITRSIDPEGKVNEYLHDPAGDLFKTQDNQTGLRTSRHNGTSYGFDAAGSLIERKNAKGSTEFTWDEAGRLKTACLPNGSYLFMRYDALGRRTSKGETRFAWDGEQAVSDCKEGEKPREFVYYPGTFEPFASIEGDGQVRYFNNDVVGLPHEIYDESGTLLWSARYDALGRTEKVTAKYGVENPLRFQGQYYDSELDLCYNRHRYYDPETCSFISQDPLGLAAGDNLYQYAPNVWGWIDPLGLCKEKPVVIGENMKRVQQYADEIGGHAYRPWENDPFDYNLGMRRNKRWIEDIKRQDRDIIDIGPDFPRRSLGREPSDFYNMERTQLKGYGNYRKVFERTGRTSGGVPGLDF